MRAISLWQPWATAIALGTKRIETRGWSTDYRGPLLIHAAKRWEAEQREFAAVEQNLARLPLRIPLGAIVAAARLVDVKPTEELIGDIGALERLYGDYSPGRFGWVLEEVRAFVEPIPFRGSQGFFMVPDRLVPVTER
jgi:hypothetical protein